MAFARMLRNLVRDPNVGPLVVPIVADEARTFGLEPIIAESKIYAPEGQRYTPVDAGLPLSYAESRSGQLLEEGITEAGATGGVHRSRDVVRHVGDARCCPSTSSTRCSDSRGSATSSGHWATHAGRGILAGCTAGRTTLLGEGLQHADGHSPLLASSNPACVVYDPAFAYELAVVLEDAVRRILGPDPEDRFWYITLYNENYPMPPLPGTEEGDSARQDEVRSGILAGAYRYATTCSCERSPNRAGGDGDRRPTATAAKIRKATLLFSGSAWRAASGCPRHARRRLGHRHRLVVRHLLHRATGARRSPSSVGTGCILPSNHARLTSPGRSATKEALWSR